LLCWVLRWTSRTWRRVVDETPNERGTRILGCFSSAKLTRKDSRRLMTLVWT
jgi:hypothetical protein